MNMPRYSSFLLACYVLLLLSSGIILPAEKDTSLEEALQQFRAAGSFFTDGQTAYHKGDQKKALTSMEKCLTKMPRHIYAHYYMANLFYIQEDYTQAKKHMQQALANFDFMQQLNTYADKQKFKQLGDFEQALEGLWDTTNSCRDSRELEFAFDRIDKVEGDLEIAARKKQQRLERMHAHYFYFNGNIQFQQKKIPEAMRSYQQAVKLDPAHAAAYNNIIAILYMAEQYDPALAYLETAEKQGLEDNLNLKLKEMLFKALDKPTAGILQEALSTGISPVKAKRLALSIPRENSQLPPVYANCYIVFHADTKQGVLIDPGVRDARIEDYVQRQGITLKAILNTHGHYDHSDGNQFYADLYKVPAYAHKNDLDYYESPPDKYISDDQNLTFDGFSIQVLHTPGHSSGSLCFKVGDFLFSGDTLFRQDIGRIFADNEKERGKNRTRLLQLIRDKLLVLPDNTVVCPGHGRTSSIAAEKKNNPFFN